MEKQIAKTRGSGQVKIECMSKNWPLTLRGEVAENCNYGAFAAS